MHHLRPFRAAGLAEPISHYSDAILAGDTLYVSGLVATDATGDVAGAGDVVEPTRPIFQSAKAPELLLDVMAG